MREVFIIKFGELWLKSEFVRNQFAKRLAENLRRMLKSEGIAFKLEKKRDMLVLESKDHKVKEVLKRTFGISWFAKAKETNSDMKSIEKAVVVVGKKIRTDQTFAIRASRSDKSFKISSMNIENKIGGKIKRKVNLSDPDFTIFIEVKKGRSYVYHDKVKAAGGLPYGVSGRVVSMISGGIDSPVASWLMMKRGCSVDFINFYVDKKGARKVEKMVSLLSEYSPEKLNLHVVPYEKILRGIIKYCETKMTCVLCKRLMYRISEKFAERMKAKALITGENLGQVASQTLDNLTTNTSAVQIPILRPLIGMDKEETISLSKKIGTFDISIKEAGPCSFVPRKPATRSRAGKIILEEEKISGLDKMVLNAIEDSKRVVV